MKISLLPLMLYTLGTLFSPGLAVNTRSGPLGVPRFGGFIAAGKTVGPVARVVGKVVSIVVTKRTKLTVDMFLKFTPPAIQALVKAGETLNGLIPGQVVAGYALLGVTYIAIWEQDGKYFYDSGKTCCKGGLKGRFNAIPYARSNSHIRHGSPTISRSLGKTANT